MTDAARVRATLRARMRRLPPPGALMPVRFLPFLALVPAALLALRSAAAQQATTACRPGPWSAPWTLTMRDGRPVYVDVPRPARSSAGLAFLGAPTFVWSTATVFADTGAG